MSTNPTKPLSGSEFGQDTPAMARMGSSAGAYRLHLDRLIPKALREGHGVRVVITQQGNEAGVDARVDPTVPAGRIVEEWHE